MAHAVLFDLDGTVWDSWPWYAELLDTHDAGPLENQLALIKGGRPAARLLRDARIDARKIRSACTHQAPPLYDGVAEAISVLHEAGVLLGAVTNLPKWLYEPMLEAHREDLPLDTVVGWADARRKPNPDGLELALARLDAPRNEQHWYVGDTPGDAEATVASGMRFAWASWGYGHHQPEGTALRLTTPVEIGSLA